MKFRCQSDEDTRYKPDIPIAGRPVEQGSLFNTGLATIRAGVANRLFFSPSQADAAVVAAASARVGAGQWWRGPGTSFLIILVVQAQAAVQGLQQLAGGVLLPGGAGHFQTATVNLFGLLLLTKLL